ncbi:unnamed protein product, partial [Symbiodinium microadriaticum]
MLKAGSSSVGAWLHALDSSGSSRPSRPAEFSRRLFAAFRDGELTVSGKFLSWIFGPEGLGVSVTSRLHPWARRALVKRFFFETRPQKTASKLLLPPGWCMPCCAAGSGRLPVMLVRSPYRRVHSYFRHKWLANPSKEPLTGWKDLPEFVRKLAEHRTLNRSLPPLFTEQDLYHTLSFHEILRDIRWSAAAREAMRLRMCVLRLEVLHMDFLHLHAVLCRWFRFCERLPAIPEIIPTGLRPYLAVPSPPWETLWTKDAVQNMLQLFASDFEELGYSVDPLQKEEKTCDPLVIERSAASGAASSEVKNAIEGKSADEIAAALKELPADQLAKVKEAVGKGPAAAACPGPVDCSKITVVGKDYKGLLEQPAEPKFKGALAQIFVRSQPYGGSDKSNN